MKRYISGLMLLAALPLCAVAQEQTRTVKGTVVDAATGRPVAGAIVKASGFGGYSTLTDDDGGYELQLPLYASSLTVTSPDHNLGTFGLTAGERQHDVRLYATAFTPDYTAEVNVVASPATSSLAYSSALNVKEEIQSQLGAYAYSVSRSGTPGIGSVMFVQGLNSLNANAQPLVVVDGIIIEQQYDRSMLHQGFYNDILTSISPSDIERVEVLRNGTALYGARGANGVILITTRRSSSMTTRITARASAGVRTEPKFLSMMSAEEYRGYASELLKGTDTRISNFKFLNADPAYYYYKQYHNDTDWKDQVYRTAITQNYGISVEGGDDVAMYNLMVGFTSDESTLERNDMKRLHLRFNSDINITERLKVKFDASFSNVTRSLRDDGAPLQYDEGTPTAPSFLAYAKAPFLSPYSYGNGILSDSYLDVGDETYLDEALANYHNYNYKLGNPYALNQYADAENKNHLENSILGIAIGIDYAFGHGISLSELFGYTLVNTNNKYFIPYNGIPSYYVSSVSATRDNEVRSLASKQNSIQSDTRIKWGHLYGAHDVRLFGGVRLNFEDYQRNAQLGYNTGSDKTPFMSSSLLNAQSDGTNDRWRTADIYAQADYSLCARYFAQLNLTATGSSRFGADADGLKVAGAVWGVFPSVQLGWDVTGETWFDVRGIDWLRLSAGYDVSGNDGIGYTAARSYFKAQMFLNTISGLSFGGIGNTELKWETTRRVNAGLQGGFLHDRIHLSADVYHSVTDDLLSLQTLGFLSGIDQNWANSGKLQNTGFDVALTGKVVVRRDWQWQVGATLGHYKNEVKALADGVSTFDTDLWGGTVRTQVGQPANLFYGYRTRGVFATTDEAAASGLYVLDDNGVDRHPFAAGDVIFADLSATNARGQSAPGQIDEADRTVIGDPNPDLYGNLFTSLQWRRLRLDVGFNYVIGRDVYNYMRSQLESGSRFMNQTTALTQRWMMEGQATSVPRASFGDPMGNARFSDRWIEDGSYLRLCSVTLSYDLPINATFLQGLQVWIQGNNLATFTRYLGSDPEFAATGDVIGQGIDLGCLGQSPSIIAGIKLNL